jgi:hypothetical protein
MDDDEHEEPRKSYPLSPAKMSKTPSWVMLGFFLGAAFVWTFKRDAVKPVAMVPSAATVTEWPKSVLVPPPSLTTIEAVFADWGKHAVWEDNVTEVAMWRSETNSFSDFYEVRKVGDVLYFRSIAKLTRLVIRHGVPLPQSPLQFTETEAQYREWLEHGRVERPKDAPRPSVPPPPQMRPPALPRTAAPAPTDSMKPGRETLNIENPPKT